MSKSSACNIPNGTLSGGWSRRCSKSCCQIPYIWILILAEVTDPGEIGKYAFVLVLPTLVINEKVVCSGRFPSKEEVAGWLLEVAEDKQQTSIPLP